MCSSTLGPPTEFVTRDKSSLQCYHEEYDRLVQEKAHEKAHEPSASPRKNPKFDDDDELAQFGMDVLWYELAYRLLKDRHGISHKEAKEILAKSLELTDVDFAWFFSYENIVFDIQ